MSQKVGKSKPKKVTSSAKDKIIEEDHNNNTQDKIPIPDINKNDIVHEEEHEQEVDFTKVRETRVPKSGAIKKYRKGNLPESQTKLKKQRDLVRMKLELSEEEIAEKLAADEEKRRKRAEQKLEIQAKFMKASAEQKAKIKKMSSDEKKAYYKARAKKGVENRIKRQAGLVFPVDRISKKIRARFPSTRFTKETAVFTAAVLEYMTAELLELAGNVAKDNKRSTIKPRHIMLAASYDEEIDKVIGKDTIFYGKAGCVPSGVQKVLLKSHTSTKNDTWSVDLKMKSMNFK